MEWIPLEQPDNLEFLDTVRDKNDPALSEPVLCDVYKLQLPFYDGYWLYRIVNSHMIPHLCMDFISNGTEHYYMDGSDTAFQTLNAKGALSLDQTNVVDYLDLYISYVYERGNSLEFIRNPHATTQKGAGAMEAHFNAIKYHQETSVTFDKQKNAFHITTPMIYQEDSVQTKTRVEKSGAIHISEPITVSFLTDPKADQKIHYRHNRETSLIDEAKTLMEQTDAGKELLDIMAETGAQVRVLTSPNYQTFTTNDKIIYILMPAIERSAKYLQMIALAFGIIDTYQIKNGWLRPAPDSEEVSWNAINYGKNLDIAVQTCKIIEELEQKNIKEAITAFQKMGLGRVYSGYKNDLSMEELLGVYLQSMDQYGFIKGEQQMETECQD